MALGNLELKRLTLHKIYGKSDRNPTPYAEECNGFCKLDYKGLETLRNRVNNCLNHKSKFYELHLEDFGPGSIHKLQVDLWGTNENHFVEISQDIASKAAEVHSSANIPDGLLLVIEGTVGHHKAIIIVKAEKSDAFSINGTDLELIKDIFLSSDKTLYKVAFIIHTDRTQTTVNAYKYYVYDDVFSPSKEDLAYYFYGKFLGLTTKKNSKLLSNKLHRRLMGFCEDHIEIGDCYTVMRAVDRYIIDSIGKPINAMDFSTFFPVELKEMFNVQIVREFPSSFILDNSILKSSDTKRISLTENTTLLLKNAPEGILTGSTNSMEDKQKLQMTIDSGNEYNFALVPTSKRKRNS